MVRLGLAIRWRPRQPRRNFKQLVQHYDELTLMATC
jgi:hypothetical protein